MPSRLLAFILLLSACSQGPQADLPAVGEARSLGAEWAMVNELAAAGKVTRIYADTMRANLREQLQTTAKGLTRADSRYGEEIQALLAQPDDAPPQELRAHVEKLRQIEDSLESA